MSNAAYHIQMGYLNLSRKTGAPRRIDLAAFLYGMAAREDAPFALRRRSAA
jgi:hypothetical protein